MKFPTPPNSAGSDGAPAARVLIAESDPVAAESLAEFFTREGHAPTTALSAHEALTLARNADGPGFDAALIDLNLPDARDADLLRDVQRARRDLPVIVMTGYGSVESAVECLRLGACDYLTKPLVDEELRLALERALRQRTLLRENVTLRGRLEQKFAIPNIIGGDPRMAKVFDLVKAVAPSRTTVLMTGESGTGKSLIAHAIHHHSPRKDKPFVELACGSIPETLLESELFGHVKGAFTGAHVDKVGRFLAANGGTIFLDEINSASPAMQLKLLRVLQERKFEPVGSSQTVEVDVRVILASNQPLEGLVAQGLFRQDLYYRINVVKIELAPLRDRVTDIEGLAHFFLEKYAADLQRMLVGFTPDALDALRRYHYPGNVRELQNIIERAAVLARGQTIELCDLPEHVSGPSHTGALHATTAATSAAEDSPWVPMSLDEALREPEKRIIMKALKANHWNRQKTSEQLGINRTTLYKKMKALGMLAPHEGDGDTRLAG